MLAGKSRTLNAHPVPPDCSVDHLERCWLKAHNEAAALQSECQLLEQVFRVVQADWRDVRERLAQSEALRDALGARCMGSSDADLGALHALPMPLSHGSAA